MKLNHIFAIIAIALLSASCQDFLNLSDPNAVTTGNYYQNETDMQNSLNGAYAVLKEGNFMGSSNPYFEECKARMLTYPDTGVNAGENASFDNCTVVPSNQFVLSRWNTIYKCIDRVNVLLKHLDDITYTNASVRNNIEGEARFIRALCYYTLVCDWGDVPVVLAKLESLAEVKAANFRKPKADVYQAIYDDCEWVISNSSLPDLQGKAGVGHASKVAAQALYGKALLQKATDADFASEKSSLCSKAISQLTAAWNKKPFGDFTTVDVTEIWDVANQASAKENIFQLDFVGGSNAANSSYNTSFRTSNIDDASKEVNAKKSAGGFFMSVPKAESIWNEAGDKRFDILMGKGKTSGGLTGYYTVKYKDLDASGYYGCNNVVLRYADVAMMLAEANYHNGNATEAVKWVNMVRNRAGLANTTATSGTALRDVIYKERQREFAYEFKAWTDLKRGYNASEITSIMKADGATEFDNADLLLPIPHAQWLLNPEGLYQNPGYKD